MAQIVLGVAAPHSPLLAVRPDQWELPDGEAAVGGGTTSSTFPPPSRHHGRFLLRGEVLDHAGLAAARAGEGWEERCTPDARQDAYDRCLAAQERQAEALLGADLDAMVIIGDDHLEWFGHGVTPSFMIYNGERVTNFALTPAQREHGVGVHNNPIRHAGQLVNRPPEDTDYPLHPELAEHLVRSVVADHIDIAECRNQPVGPDGAVLNLPYAFTFVQRRILSDRLLPMVPVMVNAYFPPIQPTARRCFEFGQALGRAIRSWDRPDRIAVVAAGGMSHVVIDEELDRLVLDSLAHRKHGDLTALPEPWLQGGNSELKEWITTAGVLADSALEFRELDYTQVVRSEAGTGQGMGYGIWS
ncbi:hypothetical protein [Actinomycetospora sp. TBRC 11914]|uniref:DODA-type extradiol aromatic ring-opening family dioxygenase n=1 Tax=Actinomycetospora sp. TBRC 11914 TaxID=2729387 RepID=UPI00145FAB8C|nr:hypothetical protein [Actinomycetospora sp. TBRC 11914]NMO91717.1 hypothetical protein [Actinomycetospora sp. TBRC 11914]